MIPKLNDFHEKSNKKSRAFKMGIVVISIFIIILFSVLNTIGINNLISNPTNNNNNNSNTLSNNGNQIPKTSAPYNTKLFLFDDGRELNQSHTIIGNSFKLRGYVQIVEGGSFQNKSGLKVYPIIDGISYDGQGGLNGHSDVNLTVYSGNWGSEPGDFEIEIPVSLDYEYSSNMSLLANITAEPASAEFPNGVLVNKNTVQSPPIEHEITTTTNMEIIFPGIDKAVLPDDDINVIYNVTDANNQPLPFSTAENRINMYINQTPAFQKRTALSPIADTGSNQVPITERMDGWTHIGFEFLNTTEKYVRGDSFYEYEYSNKSIELIRVASCEVLNNSFKIINADNESAPVSELGNPGSYSQIVYPSGDVRILGTLAVNGSESKGDLLSEHSLNIHLNGEMTPFDQIDINDTGGFDYTFNLEDDAGFIETNTTFQINFMLEDFDSTIANYTDVLSNFTLEVQDAPPIPEPPVEEPNVNNTQIGGTPEKNWGKIAIPIVVVVGVIVGLVVFQRKRMDILAKREALLRVVDKTGKMGIIMSLCDAGKWREAIAYTYHIYSDLINEKYAISRKPHQTLREFAIICVTKYGQDPLRIYPYVSLVESVIYGNLKVDEKVFEKAMNLFGNIFQELTGSVMKYALMKGDEVSASETIEIEIQEN